MKSKLLPNVLVAIVALNPVPAWQSLAHAQWADAQPTERVNVIDQKCRPENGCYSYAYNDMGADNGDMFWELPSWWPEWAGGPQAPSDAAMQEVIKGIEVPCPAKGESGVAHQARAMAECSQTVMDAFPGLVSKGTATAACTLGYTTKIKEAYAGEVACKG